MENAEKAELEEKEEEEAIEEVVLKEVVMQTEPTPVYEMAEESQ